MRSTTLRKLTSKEFLAIIPLLEQIMLAMVDAKNIEIVIDVDLTELAADEDEDDEGTYDQAG